MSHVDTDDCRKLWVAVLAQAVADLQINPSVGDSTKRQARREAIWWFENPGRGLRMVCEMLGIDPEHLLRAYHEGRLHKHVVYNHGRDHHRRRNLGAKK